MSDHIHLTVATVVERAGKFLTVLERDGGQLVYNQPAGHVEPGEKIATAAIRETLEETGWHIRLTGLLSLSTYLAPNNGTTYYRVCLVAEAVEFDPDSPIDPDIISADWYTPDDLKRLDALPRSPLVQQAMDDFQSGIKYPLSMLRE